MVYTTTTTTNNNNNNIDTTPIRLKGEEYSSPSNIIQVYRQKYSQHLTHMPIPLQAFNNDDITQAVKDLKRERVTVNKIEYTGNIAIINHHHHHHHHNHYYY
jgi:hypothetical protein